jgi:hypothetical protein
VLHALHSALTIDINREKSPGYFSADGVDYYHEKGEFRAFVDTMDYYATHRTDLDYKDLLDIVSLSHNNLSRKTMERAHEVAVSSNPPLQYQLQPRAQKMNWYKIAQNDIPVPVFEIKMGHSWIDLFGNIFFIDKAIYGGMPHENWAIDYRDFIDEKYNMDIDVNTDIIKYDMVKNGWIIVYRNNTELYFTLNQMNDYSNMKHIEDAMFNSLDLSDDVIIELESLIDKQWVSFEWLQYIESGENFRDFVLSKTNSMGDF